MFNVLNLWGVLSLEIFEEFFGVDMGFCINSQFYFIDFFVNVFYKLNDKIYEFMFKYLFCVKIGYQKIDVVFFNGFFLENNKVFSLYYYKMYEFFVKDFFNFVSLFYCYVYF